MRAGGVRDSAAIIAELEAELARTKERWYAHRIDVLLQVAKGKPYREVAAWFGEPARTVAHWWRSYLEKGLAGLREQPPPGRPGRLSASQLKEIASATRHPPAAAQVAGSRWTGKGLAEWIERRFGIRLSVRHARRILREVTELPPTAT